MTSSHLIGLAGYRDACYRLSLGFCRAIFARHHELDVVWKDPKRIEENFSKEAVMDVQSRLKSCHLAVHFFQISLLYKSQRRGKRGKPFAGNVTSKDVGNQTVVYVHFHRLLIQRSVQSYNQIRFSCNFQSSNCLFMPKFCWFSGLW